MSDEVREVLLFQSLIGNEYSDFFVGDKETVECLGSMYFYIMCDNDILKDKYFQNFEEKYDKLTSEQQEIVKEEYLNIIETQKRNKEKEKRKE